MNFEDLYKETLEYLEAKCPEMATDIRVEVATWLTQRAMIKCVDATNESVRRMYKDSKYNGVSRYKEMMKERIKE